VVVVALDDQLAFVHSNHFCRQDPQTVHFAMHQPTMRAAQCHAS
jgi:surface antigen